MAKEKLKVLAGKKLEGTHEGQDVYEITVASKTPLDLDSHIELDTLDDSLPDPKHIPPPIH